MKITMPCALTSQAAAPTGPSPPGISYEAALAHLVSRQAMGGCWPYHADIVAVQQNFRKLCVVSRVVADWGNKDKESTPHSIIRSHYRLTILSHPPAPCLSSC